MVVKTVYIHFNIFDEIVKVWDVNRQRGWKTLNKYVKLLNIKTVKKELLSILSAILFKYVQKYKCSKLMGGNCSDMYTYIYIYV